MSAHDPLVSVVTPVYNAEKYLDECIRSVLSQTYQNWEYIIVNNCSTDRTLTIAGKYAQNDPRIQVYTNKHFVGVIKNHNIAFTLISPKSKYCKVVSADDWIFPHCIERLVEIGEQHPSVGVIGAYGILGDRAICFGLPLGTNLFPGREVCRLRLFGSDTLGAPTNVLYRAAFIRDLKPFFAGSAPNADQDACFRVLQYSDYGFVHQILCFQRMHEEMLSKQLGKLNTFILDDIEFLVKYGPVYLRPEEYKKRLKEVLNGYYRFLAVAAINFYGRQFWHYHKNRMKEIGYRFDYLALIKAVIEKFMDLFLNPKLSIEKILKRLKK